jgi:hypothetical protein
MTNTVSGEQDGDSRYPQQRLKELFAPAIRAMRNRLGDELYGVLIHGSATWNPVGADDYDPIFVLRRPNVAGVRAIRESMAAVDWDRHVEMQVVCASQLAMQGDHFSLKANGPMFLYRLRKALVLYGDNPYRHVADPSREAFARSLVAEVQRNLWFARHAAGHGASGVTTGEIYQVTKKMWWSIKNLLMWDGADKSDSAGDLAAAAAAYPQLFDRSTWSWLHSCLAKRGFERELFHPLDDAERTVFIDECLNVHEAVYARILELAEREFGLTYLVPEG